MEKKAVRVLIYIPPGKRVDAIFTQLLGDVSRKYDFHCEYLTRLAELPTVSREKFDLILVDLAPQFRRAVERFYDAFSVTEHPKIIGVGAGWPRGTIERWPSLRADYWVNREGWPSLRTDYWVNRASCLRKIRKILKAAGGQ